MGREEGSALMLMPAAVLVVLVLAAIAVDLSLLFLGEREMADAADAAAHDAAAVLDEAHYRATGEVRVRCDDAAAVAAEALEARRASWLRSGVVEVVACGDRAVTVEVRGRVGFVFARALPGASDGGAVSATATATAIVRS